jgi:hypothetical protein
LIARISIRTYVRRSGRLAIQAHLNAWIQICNEERAYQGRWCFGKAPKQVFLGAVPLAWKKMIAA